MRKGMRPGFSNIPLDFFGALRMEKKEWPRESFAQVRIDNCVTSRLVPFGIWRRFPGLKNWGERRMLTRFFFLLIFVVFGAEPLAADGGAPNFPEPSLRPKGSAGPRPTIGQPR